MSDDPSEEFDSDSSDDAQSQNQAIERMQQLFIDPSSPVQKKEEEKPEPLLADISVNVMRSVGRALNDASRRVGEVMAGESSFSNDGDRRVALALVGRMTQLLPMLERLAEAEAEQQVSKVIPQCPMCGAEPGKHWAHECPVVHDENRDKMVWDYGRNRMLFLKDFDTRKWEEDFYGGKIPPCGICGAAVGTHWPDECPENPIRHKMIADQVVPIERQRWYINEQRKKKGLSTIPLDGETK